MMQNEKKVPHYKLDKIKSLIKENHYVITRIAIENARNDFNIKSTEIFDYIMLLDNSHFYKSMTSEHCHKIWQDVYHLKIKTITAYIKLQISENTTSVIIQFKRK